MRLYGHWDALGGYEELAQSSRKFVMENSIVYIG